jgi:hypothetical protein
MTEISNGVTLEAYLVYSKMVGNGKVVFLALRGGWINKATD